MNIRDFKREKCDIVLRHSCEICGKEEIISGEEGFNRGWDYPPKMALYGVISPRICGDCDIKETLWWELVSKKTPVEQLCERHMQTMKRITSEPGSILPV